MPRPRHAIDIFNDVRYWTNAILNYWPAARPSDGYFGLNVFMSACLDALSDTISDEVVESMGPDAELEAVSPGRLPNSVVSEKTRKGGRKLTGPQDVIVATFWSFVLSVFYIVAIETESWGTLLRPERTPVMVMGLIGGACYVVASMTIMKAFERIPSTMIVPLAQMTGPMVEIMAWILSYCSSWHWLLLPFATSALAPAKVFAFSVIFVGSFLPCWREARECLGGHEGMLVHGRLEASLLVLASDFSYAVFTLLVSVATSPALGEAYCVSSAQFIVMSQFSASLWVAIFCVFTKRGRRETIGLRLSSRYCIGLCSVSELVNYLATISYSLAVYRYDNEGTVLAARLGLHQAINFVMAGALYMFFGFGRPPANVGVKVASGVIVSIGLYLTTMAPTTPDVGPSGMLDAPV